MDTFAVSENILAEQEKPDVNGSQNTEESNKFQRAISSWRGTITRKESIPLAVLTHLKLYRHRPN